VVRAEPEKGTTVTGTRSINKGKTWERHVVSYLQCHGLPDARRLKAGEFDDNGDVSWAGSPWLLDAKDRARVSLMSWWDEVVVEAALAELSPMLVIKRPKHGSVGSGLVVVQLSDAGPLFTRNGEQLAVVSSIEG